MGSKEGSRLGTWVCVHDTTPETARSQHQAQLCGLTPRNAQHLSDLSPDDVCHRERTCGPARPTAWQDKDAALWGAPLWEAFRQAQAQRGQENRCEPGVREQETS